MTAKQSFLIKKLKITFIGMSFQYIASEIAGYDDKNNLYEAIIDGNSKWVKSENIINKEILESYVKNNNQRKESEHEDKPKSEEESNSSNDNKEEDKKKLDKIAEEHESNTNINTYDAKIIYSALQEPIEEILGADMLSASKNDLIFAIKYKNHPEIHFVSHNDVKKYHLYELIDFYEKRIRLGAKLAMPPYKPANK